MKHYEIVYLIRPAQSEQAPQIIEHYTALVKKRDGKIHRLEDWGRRQLAYPIDDERKAHYVLMNIECDQETLAELKHAFRYNDAVLRELILNKSQAETQPSVMVKKKKEGEHSD